MWRSIVPGPSQRIYVAALLVIGLTAASCGDSGTAETGTGIVDESKPSTAVSSDNGALVVLEDTDLVYLSDEHGDWTLRVFYPDAAGPWPLVVVVPPGQSVSYAGEEIARRGAVAVVADAWARPEAWVSDPALHLYGEMDRAACVVGWAQAHAADYGADPARTTVDGYSGGAMAAAWAGLGQADDSRCPNEIQQLPVGLVLGESQFLFHNGRWDPFFETDDPEPAATLAGLIDPTRWVVSPDLRVALWSAERPIGETRAIDNPPGPDSWVWPRDTASPFVADLERLGALDDGLVDWADNADLMADRMRDAGVDVTNDTFPVPHSYTADVYELILSIQS